jgi:hypothetical protein
MYLSVIKECMGDIPTMQTIDAFSACVDDLGAQTLSISGFAGIQSAKITGSAKDKSNAQIAMVDKALPIAGAVNAWATMNNNMELADKMDFTRSELLRADDANSADECQSIHATATTHLIALNGYGPTADKLIALQTAIDAYRVFIPKPRASKIDRKMATAAIKTQFALAKTTLKAMDKLAQGFKETYPVFYARYKAARIIVDNGNGGHKSNGATPPAPPQ